MVRTTDGSKEYTLESKRLIKEVHADVCSLKLEIAVLVADEAVG